MIVSFIGEKYIDRTYALKNELAQLIEDLIVNEKADIFLFGGKSDFDGMSYEIVTDLHRKYEDIRRVFIRADYEFLSESYLNHLMMYYEDTYCPPNVRGAGALANTKRNEAMVEMCDTLVTYYDPDYKPVSKKRSSVITALEYAKKRNKRIINIFE